MFAVMKTPHPTVDAMGSVVKDEMYQGLDPVEMVGLLTPWSASSRSAFPSLGTRYVNFETEIVGENDQNQWGSIVRKHFGIQRQLFGERMSQAEKDALLARLTGWPATYKSWAGI